MPPTKSPWDPAPLPEYGAPDPDILYRNVGWALSQWEAFEAAFCWIFRALIGAEYTYPVERAYGSVLTFRGRSDMVAAAAEVLWITSVKQPRKVLQRDTVQFLKQAVGFSGRRNEIAHGIVELYSNAYIYESRPGWVIGPSWYASNKTVPAYHAVNTPKYLYSDVQVLRYGEGFRSLRLVASKLAERIEAREQD